MRDDLTAPNLGQADRTFDAPFFWQSYRMLEQLFARLLAKGPISVTKLEADEINSPKITGNLTGDVTGNVTGGHTTGTAAFSTVTVSTSLNPTANGTVDLGTAALRWRTVYTSDLDLNNGIGDWTIVEGEDDLFLYNNKKGKTYKFALTEVDPSEAPAKKD